MDIVSPHKVNMANTHTQILHIHVESGGSSTRFGYRKDFWTFVVWVVPITFEPALVVLS